MLPRQARLKRRRDFQAVYRRRKSCATNNLVLYFRDRSSAGPLHSRFGFVISKKVAKRAHDRNLIKRRLREICRHEILPVLPPDAAYDILIVARAPVVGQTYAALAADVGTLATRAGLLRAHAGVVVSDIEG